MIDNPPDWLREWSRQIGAELKDGLRESPSWIAFARENGTVYHTYTVMAPDPVRRALLQLSCSSERRRPNPPSPVRGARTSTGMLRQADRPASFSLQSGVSKA
jgi:hypothetical protein